MSHPDNKRERFLIGDREGKRRSKGRCNFKTVKERQEYQDAFRKRYRDTTKLCSCEMCGNPRKRGELTMQERRYNVSLNDIQIILKR